MLSNSTCAATAWDAVNALPASAFVSRAAGERASAGHAAAEGRDEPQGDHHYQRPDNNIDNASNHSNDNRKKSRGRGGRGAKCCRSDKLSVDDFIAHLADGLGRIWQM